MDRTEITIIGAGIVGLAIAARLSKDCDDIVLIEKNNKFGQETSSRNSEVIHSGIYYPPDYMKAKFCVKGADMLYRYCDRCSIAYSKIGKLIVARDGAEIITLQELLENGIKNGIRGLELLDKEEVRKKEPSVNAVAALNCPNTGIVDTHSLMHHLYHEANSSGVIFSFGSEVDLIEKGGDGYTIGVKEDGYKFVSGIVINAAGLYSDRIAEMAGIDIDEESYRLSYCKGTYFSYSGKSPVSRLIYPVPHKDLKGLGVHATIDLGGRLRFGPDAEYVDSINYYVDSSKKETFFRGASKIINGLKEDFFIPDMAGIRPKLKGEFARDFIIKHERDKGLDGFINLIGIESPGLTASLAIADFVGYLVREHLN